VDHHHLLRRRLHLHHLLRVLKNNRTFKKLLKNLQTYKQQTIIVVGIQIIRTGIGLHLASKRTMINITNQANGNTKIIKNLDSIINMIVISIIRRDSRVLIMIKNRLGKFNKDK
jgi:hypothetical protein